MKMWRCYICENTKGLSGRDFTAEKPVCPECGADRSNPLFAQHIVALKPIHYDAPHPAFAKMKEGFKRGVNHAACDKSLTPGKCQLTGEPSVVTCPACQATEVWKQAADENAAQPAFDFNVTIDTKEGTLSVDLDAPIKK